MTAGEFIDKLSEYSFDKELYVFQEFAKEYEEDLDGSYCAEPTLKEAWIDDKGMMHINAMPGNVKKHVLVIWC